MTQYIDHDDLDEADGIGRDRALAEYGDFAARRISKEQITATIAVAERITSAIAFALAQATKR